MKPQKFNNTKIFHELFLTWKFPDLQYVCVCVLVLRACVCMTRHNYTDEEEGMKKDDADRPYTNKPHKTKQ